MIKRKLAIILALVVMAGSVPCYVFAEESTPAAGTAANGNVENDAVDTTDNTSVPPTEPTLKGWQNNRTEYYDNNGNKLKDAVRGIEGRLYYFNKSGKVTTYKNKWKTVNGARYRFNAKGKIVSKPTYIKNKKGNKTLYMFRTNGKLLVKKKGAVFKYNGKEYYSLGKGKLGTGWVALGKHAMYFNKKNDKKTGTLGSMARNTKIGHLKVPKNGRLGEAYALGVKQLDEIGWNLRSAYKYSYKLKYKQRWYRQKYTEDYAIRGFKRGNGNCYVMASTFYVMAKLLGYDITRVAGKVAGRNPHSWTVIREKGKEHIYDPNFTNETGRNGWKIWYGKSGTWRYTDYYKVKNRF